MIFKTAIFQTFRLQTIVCCAIFFFMILSVHDVFSQNYTYKHLTQRDGLATGFIYEIVEDDKGFIWIATNVGISKYDGYGFTNYATDDQDSTALHGARVYNIEQFDENTLMVASIAGLEIFNIQHQTFELVKIPKDMPQPSVAYDIELTSTDEIFVATDVGIFYFNTLPTLESETEVKFYPAPEKDENNGATRYVIELADDKTLWISYGNKLAKLDIEKQQLKLLDNLPDEINSIIESNIWEILSTERGDLLISAISGLVIWESGKNQPNVITELGELGEEEMRSASFQSITQDENGNILLGSSNAGLIIWNPNTDKVDILKHNPQNENSINSNDVHYAFVDKQGITWMGYHDEGISLMFSNTFNYEYKLADEKSDKNDPVNLITNVYEDSSGTLWFTTNNGLVKKDGDEQSSRYLIDPSNNNANRIDQAIEINTEELLIVGDSITNYYIFNKNTEQFKNVSEGHTLRGFPFMIAETESHFIFGSENGYILQINKSDYKSSALEIPFPENYNMPVKPVLAYKKNEQELYIFAIYVSAFDAPEFVIFNYDINEKSLVEIAPVTKGIKGFGLPEKSKMEEGVYWINIQNGILKLNIETNQAEVLFEQDAGVLSLSSRSANFVEDNNGYLWFNTLEGLLKLDPGAETITYYDFIESRMPNAIYKGNPLKNGNIIYFGSGGYVEFNPDELQFEGVVQNIHLTSIDSGDNTYYPMYESEDIEIDESNNNLSFSFIGLNYKEPNFTKYRYRIKGYDEEWTYIGTQQRVYLANIPSGNYTFEVQAAPRFGTYGNATASIDFKIPPPWWNTWPAYLLYAFILISSLVVFDRIQRRRVIAKERERNREKELKQAREIEVAYENLKATQKKLIQSEKMASLGELTAGIAHEIQNPLNFVNNFSEINQELVDELEAELAKGDIEEARVIAKDIKQNELKIIHHGKRADSIVKGMLQHSRNHSGEKEPTDINALCDEYLRLAYHGLRAKDKSFNATLESDFDQELGKVSVVPQDIGRVILNIINNGLYAIKDKKIKTEDPDYNPTIWVNTQKLKDKIIIGIKDNGNGIPESLRDKIFQPFFTTKSAGDGTGLGLSMSYDIIKAHGGELTVESKEGEGTLFNVELPV